MKIYKIVPGFPITVVREGGPCTFLGGTSCTLSDDEAQANAVSLTNEDGSPIDLPALADAPGGDVPSAAPFVHLLIPPEAMPTDAPAAESTAIETAIDTGAPVVNSTEPAVAASRRRASTKN